MSDEETYSSIQTLVGSTRREHRWHLTDEVDILTVFGRARFDLRGVETTGGDVVEVTVKCFFGVVDFIVPDGTVVVLDGTSFLATARSDVSPEGETELPRIEITATTVLGAVRVLSPIEEEEEVEEEAAVEEPMPEPVDEDSGDEVVNDEAPADSPEPEPAVAAVEDEPPAASEPIAEEPATADLGEESDEPEALAS